GILAHVSSVSSRRQVGAYRVDVEGFEEIALPALEMRGGVDLFLVDEIGKMECFSTRFVERMREVLDSPVPVVATVAVKGGGFIREVRSRPDVEIVLVTKENRDRLPGQMVAVL
ncbi:MAG: nucleoside-triphosphatase, partial [Planctomycetota bacterium]